VPGTMVMFTMLVLLTSGAIMLIVEREHGLLRRLASTPISPGSIVLGKWTARMAMGLVQIGFAMVVGRVLFRMDWGNSLPMVILVLVSLAAFNASLALLLANIARTQAQMAGMGVVATMVLAALGGCWWPIEITPRWMQSLALALPTGWTMDAMHRLVSFGYGAGSAVPHVAALSVAALAAGWIGTRIFRYQ
jgi:ABC-2 type transport system permease protein